MLAHRPPRAHRARRRAPRRRPRAGRGERPSAPGSLARPLRGIDDRNAAEELRGAMLVGEPLADPGDGRALGARAGRRRGARPCRRDTLGRVVAVEANPAHDLLVLDGGALVPMVFVVEQEPGVLVVDPPDGLLDVNRLRAAMRVDVVHDLPRVPRGSAALVAARAGPRARSARRARPRSPRAHHRSRTAASTTRRSAAARAW